MNLSQRYASLGYSSTEFVLRMSREEIGNYLGLTLETVSRLFSRFARDGLIRINQREVRILDQPAPKQLLGQELLKPPAPRAFLPAASLMLAALMAPLAAAAQTPLPDPYDYDEATPAPGLPARWQTVELGKPGHRYKIPVTPTVRWARANWPTSSRWWW